MATNKSKWIVPAFLVAFAIGACGHKNGAEPDTTNAYEQALAYAECLRANGVPDYPDPQRNGNAIDDNGGRLLDSPAGEKALEACRAKMPQGRADAGGSLDSAKVVDWTNCMRGKLPKFPDPEVSGNSVTLKFRGTGITESAFRPAQEACASRSPGGAVKAEYQ